MYRYERGIHMIRAFNEKDLDTVVKIWLDTNIQSHSFISKNYWKENLDMVRDILPEAEIYVYIDEMTREIEGFIGLTGNHIAGLFVRESAQSNGIGRLLVRHVKKIKKSLSLNVYSKNERAVRFYQQENFLIYSGNVDVHTKEQEYYMIWNK